MKSLLAVSVFLSAQGALATNVAPPLAPAPAQNWDNAVIPEARLRALPLDEPLRVQQPASLGVAFGDPSPSWFGVQGGYQFDSTLQLLLGGGWFGNDGLHVKTLAASSRFHVLKTDFTPFVGAGLAVYFISGEGKFQGLETTTWALPFLSLGLDWIFDSGLRLAGGVNFHFPVKLTFPFIDASISF